MHSDYDDSLDLHQHESQQPIEPTPTHPSHLQDGFKKKALPTFCFANESSSSQPFFFSLSTPSLAERPPLPSNRLPICPLAPFPAAVTVSSGQSLSIHSQSLSISRIPPRFHCWLRYPTQDMHQRVSSAVGRGRTRKRRDLRSFCFLCANYSVSLHHVTESVQWTLLRLLKTFREWASPSLLVSER